MRSFPVLIYEDLVQVAEWMYQGTTRCFLKHCVNEGVHKVQGSGTEERVVCRAQYPSEHCLSQEVYDRLL